MLKMENVVQIKHSHRPRQGIAWTEFEPMLNRLRQVLNTNNNDSIMEIVGYAGASHVSSWKRKNLVPILAVNAVNWCLHDLGARPLETRNKPVVEFTPDELGELFFLALRGSGTIPDQNRQALMKKISSLLS